MAEAKVLKMAKMANLWGIGEDANLYLDDCVEGFEEFEEFKGFKEFEGVGNWGRQILCRRKPSDLVATVYGVNDAGADRDDHDGLPGRADAERILDSRARLRSRRRPTG
jgi:hypothetical protein